MNWAIRSKSTSRQNLTSKDPFKLIIIRLTTFSSFDWIFLMKIFSFSAHSFGIVHEFWGKDNHNDVNMKNIARLGWKLFRIVILNPEKIIATLFLLECTILIEYPHYFCRSTAFCYTCGPINYQNQFCILNSDLNSIEWLDITLCYLIHL